MMTSIDFYEKPGCINNRRQKKLLEAAGYHLHVHNLLKTPWQGDELKAFFSGLPVTEWFNPSAPAIKSGDIDPQQQDESSALRLMLDDPLLIRRPLIAVGETKLAGFEPDRIHSLLPAVRFHEDLQTCPRPAEPCVEEGT